VQTFYAVDAENGRSWQLLPPDAFWDYRFTPDGAKLIAFSESSLRIVDTATGAVRDEIPIQTFSPWDQDVLFTPDQEQALLYVADGVLVLDLGEFREIIE
jgi:hypothetical protein